MSDHQLIGEDWFEKSEAKYDSMKNLLQSVRQDIDNLTNRIDSTDATSSQSELSDRHMNMNDSVTDQSVDIDIRALNELAEGDEYMDIKICHQPIVLNENQLLDHQISSATEHSIKPEAEKSWHSPTDFNMHDPFNQEYLDMQVSDHTSNITHTHHGSGCEKETDLDDIDSDKNLSDSASSGSLSPAVSPTFESLGIRNVQLDDILVTSDESGHFTFTSNIQEEHPILAEEIRLYEDAHELTTIDEASEEYEEEWSSSEIDLSSQSSNDHSGPVVQSPTNHVSQSHILTNGSIIAKFKTLSDSTLIPISVLEDNELPVALEENSITSEPVKLDSTDPVNNSSNLDQSMPHHTTHKVYLREKQSDGLIKRPISAESLQSHIRNAVDSSQHASIHSLLSVLSQDSMLSEADSYVTVCSRTATMGSEDMYATACSDTDAATADDAPKNLLGDGDVHTLSRRRRTAGKRIRTKARERNDNFMHSSSSSSSSSTEALDGNILNFSEPVVVTPKFSRLPQKIASPNDTIVFAPFSDTSQNSESNLQINGDHLAKNGSDKQTKTIQIEPRIMNDEKPKQKLSNASSNPNFSDENLSEDDCGRGNAKLYQINVNPSQALNAQISPVNANDLSDSDIDENINQHCGHTREIFIKNHNESCVILPPVNTANVVIPKFISSQQATHSNRTDEVQDKSPRASTDLSATRLAGLNQPLKINVESNLTINQCATPHASKVGNNQPISVLHTDSLETAVGIRSNENEQASVVHRIAGGIIDRDLIDEEMYSGSGGNYYTGPQYGSSHIYNDRFRELSKQSGFNGSHRSTNRPTDERNALSLAAVLVSEEAVAARPSVYSPGDIDLKQRGQINDNVYIQNEDTIVPNGSHVYLSNSSERPFTDVREASLLSSRTEANDHVQITRNLPPVSVPLQSPSPFSYKPDESTYRLASELTLYPDKLSSRASTVQELPLEQGLAKSMDLTQPNCPDTEPRPELNWSMTNKLHNQLEGHFESPSNKTMLVDGIQTSSEHKGCVVQGATSPLHTTIPFMEPPRGINLQKSGLLPISRVELLSSPHSDQPAPRPSSPMHTTSSHVNLVHAPQFPTKHMCENLGYSGQTHRRQHSPSPPMDEMRSFNPRPSSPMVRPKWQLKPIPTDSEIRERLRSRSRNRIEERRSRPPVTQTPSGYRQRSSRSDSRYRCTDLDSAIAESKVDTTLDTMHSSTQGSEVFDTKQSASLFNLNSHGQLYSKPTRTTIPSSRQYASSQQFGEAKSYTSLLETDIDTGENFERPIVLETDVDLLDTHLQNQSCEMVTSDALDSKTRSLFNLAFVSTPGPQTQGHSNHAQTPRSTEEWQRTKSLQGLLNRDRDSPYVQQQKTSYHHSHGTSGGMKGLIDRMRDRARSNHELRIADSLSKLHVPDWLDKADCLNQPPSTDRGFSNYISPVIEPQRQTPVLSTWERSRPTTSSMRSLSSYPKTSGESRTSKWCDDPSTVVETVAEPTRPRFGSSQTPRFVRPSQLLRERGESNSRLKPISSKLYSSMRSLAGDDSRTRNNNMYADIRPQVAPRQSRPVTGQANEIKLSPQDFVPRYNQRWAQIDHAISNEQQMHLRTSNFLHDEDRIDTYDIVDRPNNAHPNGMNTKTEDIKLADHDSGTEHSSERQEIEKAQERYRQQDEVKSRKNGMHTANQEVFDNYDLPDTPVHAANGLSPTSEWHSIDADGETESEATDGLDQISDLTCLTALVDTSASRHKTLLANRPSALEHLLTSMGWWPLVPQTEHRRSPPTAAEAISIAAHEFDVDEDSHRNEFIRLLAGPQSRRPVNLSEFALNHLSGSVQRKQEDGLLYISCGRSECSSSHIQVSHAFNWCACANCYTLYCSEDCRAIDRRTFTEHPTVCSFARAKRVCNRLLRHLAPGQLASLTALAKSGAARLGRGGILLPFASVKHAECFLDRARKSTFLTGSGDKTTFEEATNVWEQQHQPSPGGLMSPPLYLTLNELDQLDSTVAGPCRNYVPSSSMVIFIVVCAYELIARSDGRPVHLFKQSIIVPFPSQNNHNTNHNSPTKLSPTKRLGAILPDKPVLPQRIGPYGNGSERQAIAARESYMIRLQRVLRERGVSLRHHHPDIYAHIAQFVETGQPFVPISIIFHDFILRSEVRCTIKPMLDPHIEPIELVAHANSDAPTQVPNWSNARMVQHRNLPAYKRTETDF